MCRETVRVYKMYGAKRALENLSQGRLKVSTLKDLNDPFEFRGFKFEAKDQRSMWEKFRKKVFERTGVICFFQSWKNPVVWSHYGENHRGIAIGLDVPRQCLVHVKYRKTRTLAPDLTKLSDNELTDLNQTILSTKYKHWEYENEVRTFVPLENPYPDTGLFFKNFDSKLVPKEVVIGPLSEVTSDQLESIVKKYGLEKTTSRLAFNSYRVVKQRLKQLQK